MRDLGGDDRRIRLVADRPSAAVDDDEDRAGRPAGREVDVEALRRIGPVREIVLDAGSGRQRRVAGTEPARQRRDEGAQGPHR